MIQEEFQFYKPREALRPYVRYYWVFKSHRLLDTAVQMDATVGGLPFGERVVYLVARVEQRLFKAQRGFRLSCFGYLPVVDVRTFKSLRLRLDFQMQSFE